MLIVISPAKTLNAEVNPQTTVFSQPDFMDEAADLVAVLRKYSPTKLQKLMRINPKLAEHNATRYLDWHRPFTPENATPALLTFKGEVYNGIKAETMRDEDLLFLQDRLRILSGMYGALRPLDLMQAYRLEMGTKLKVKRKKDLYHFWGSKITDHINKALANSDHKFVINLASNEYFNALDVRKIDAEIITPTFMDFSGGQYKFITVYGKKARGMMVRFIAQNRIEEVENLKLFDAEGYYYNDQLSEGNNWVFTRG
jgi:hypothetical protein